DTPADEAVLVFVFKRRPGERTDYRSTLLADLRKAGVDTEATITVTEGNTSVTKRRINVATWGMETSLSCFSHCRVVILAGVLQRSPVDLAGAFLGQTDDLLGHVKSDDISRLALSEVCHVVYQALSRGSCRVIEDGKARPMHGYLIHRDIDLQAELSKVIPGAVWKTWEPKHGDPRKGIIASTAARIADHLSQLPATTTKFSTRQLRADLGLTNIHTSTLKAAVREVVSLVPWRSEGRSLTRLFVEPAAT